MPVLFVDRRAGQCAWPLWSDADPLGRRECCGAPAEPGKPYCEAHRSRGVSRIVGRAAETGEQSAHRTLKCIGNRESRPTRKKGE